VRLFSYKSQKTWKRGKKIEVHSVIASCSTFLSRTSRMIGLSFRYTWWVGVFRRSAFWGLRGKDLMYLPTTSPQLGKTQYIIQFPNNESSVFIYFHLYPLYLHLYTLIIIHTNLPCIHGHLCRGLSFRDTLSARLIIDTIWIAHQRDISPVFGREFFLPETITK